MRALVIATGGLSERGKLVKEILFPAEFNFVFNEELKVVIPILIIWGYIVFIIQILALKVFQIESWFLGIFIYY